MGATNSEVAHNWAHQSKNSQHGSHFWFSGNVIYSYSTVIGQVIYTKDKKPVYFINTGSYSVSTCKHQSHVFNAIPGGAAVFSASCGDFIYNWDGIAYCSDKISEAAATCFVVKNLEKVYALLLEFKQGKILKYEREFSLYYFYEALRFLEYFPIVSLSKILRRTNPDMKKSFGIADPTNFRKYVRTVMSGVSDLKTLVDIVCGGGAYDAYHKRTLGYRMTERTKKFNHLCGFNTNSYSNAWYMPYQFRRTDSGCVHTFPTNHTYITHELKTSGKGFSTQQILRHCQKGDLIKTLYKAKQKNFLEACEKYAIKERNHNVQKAKKRLELFIGLRGWSVGWINWYKKRVTSFNYNGTIFTFHSWNEESQLSDEEYAAFGKMSKEEQREFVRLKRAEMLEELQRQDYNYEHRVELAEKARMEREKELAEKREYIAFQKTRGNEGLRQLWHEGLITSDSLTGKPISLFYGGNVLLRVVHDGSKIITSKGISIPLNECKRLWSIINRWHENNTQFVQNDEIVHATRGQTWGINRFQNDILVAGCHAIAYREMAEIAKQLNF